MVLPMCKSGGEALQSADGDLRSLSWLKFERMKRNVDGFVLAEARSNMQSLPRRVAWASNEKLRNGADFSMNVPFLIRRAQNSRVHREWCSQIVDLKTPFIRIVMFTLLHSEISVAVDAAGLRASL